MQRVMIIGQPGSGKSWLARELGRITALPVVHIDQIHWQAGWVERSRADKDRLCAEVHAREAWIFEGGHSRTWDERMARADTVIWLDRPVLARLWAVFWRSWRDFGQVRPDLPTGCPEQFDAAFYRYIWRTRVSGAQSIARLMAKVPATKAAHHLRNRAEVAAYLADQAGSLGASR